MRIFVRYLLFPGLLALFCLLVLLNGLVQEVRLGIATRRRINARPIELVIR